MTARLDLRRLLDDVAMRATRIEIVVDARLEQSVQATVHSDRHGDAAVVLTRYAADSAAEALEAALADTARWSNAQPSGRRPIRLDTIEPMLALIAMVRRLAAMSGGVDDVTAREAYELAGKVAAL